MAVLLKIYATRLDGQDAIASRRIEEALGDPGEDDTGESPPPADDSEPSENLGAYSAKIAAGDRLQPKTAG